MKGMKITAWLWSSPSLPHWQRLLLFWFYIPLLVWRFLIGKPVLLGEEEELIAMKTFAESGSASIQLDVLKNYVQGIIPFLERHLQEIHDIQDRPEIKHAVEVGYLDCLGTLKDALFEAGLVNGEGEE